MKKSIVIALVLGFGYSLANARGVVPPVSLDARKDGGGNKEQEAMSKFNLTQIRDQKELRRFIAKRLLVRVPSQGRGFYLDKKIGQLADANQHLYCFARAWTVRFIKWLGQKYWRKFKSKFKITSLIRTCLYQKRLARGNVNAAACGTSSHLTGATFDVTKKGMSLKAVQWMRKTLLAMERSGNIQGTEERIQPVFHIMVLPKK